MDEEAITFLPYIKRQPPLTISGDNLGHLTATLQLNIVDNNGNSNSVGSHALTLRGPGDILGISKNMVARVEPPPATHDFEPNYFPFLEFVDLDFPWRYSLANVETMPSKAHPWLSLIVLSKDEIDEMTDEGAEVITLLNDRRRILSVKGRYLPNLEDAWATAHVHFTRLNKAIDEFIEDHPDKHCARLFCCRKLSPETAYTAFLIPNYKIGVQAAFGLPLDGVGDAKAWENPDNEDIIKLPIYYYWSFSTAESGDFESLARKLKPSAVDPKKIGTRAVDANLMMPLANSDFNRFFLREGALAAPGFSENRTPYSKGSQSLPLTCPMLNSLNESLKSSMEPLADNVEDDVDPLITMPVYGRYFRKTEAIEMPDKDRWPDATPWIHELNLDFRHRVAAAFGTKVVQDNQEEYVKECWSQVGEIRKANEQLRRTQAGYKIAKALEAKHIAPLSDERFVFLSSPFHTHFATEQKGVSVSIKQTLAKSGISRGVFSPTFRRVAHRRIGINRVKPLNVLKITSLPPILRARRAKKQKIVEASMIVGDFLSTLPGSNAEVLAPKTEVIPVTPIDTGLDFRARFNIKNVLKKQLKAVIRFNNGATIPENFDQIMRFPRVNQAMYRPLKTLSEDYILPGIENLQNNGVTLCEENRRFIEAHMVGLNHEMGRELVWRFYPTDQRGTIFSYFWDPVSAGKPPTDIEEIHKWTNELGLNKDAASKGANLVLVIKGDLIRRYPGTTVYTVKITAPREFWSEAYPDNNPPVDPNHLIEPVFRAQISSDILFVGFPFSIKDVQGADRDGEYYFVLQENQDLPRFGLDVASERMNRSGGCGDQEIDINDCRWCDVSKDNAGYINDFSIFGRNSAAVATKTYQLPIRVAIHASELLPEVRQA